MLHVVFPTREIKVVPRQHRALENRLTQHKVHLNITVNGNVKARKNYNISFSKVSRI
jgi:hypothetical protein